MKSDEFWSVELGVGMGPLVLGAAYESLLEALRTQGIDTDRLMLDRAGKVVLPDVSTQLIFSSMNPRTLERIDVSDQRLRFGSLVVIGKRVHEIIGIFKLSRKATLWCNLDPDADTLAHSTLACNSQGSTTQQSRELLARGTIWIPKLGLGLTLRDGLVATVHLCDPVHSPRVGTGSWTKEQQMLSEVRELPPASLMPTETRRKRASIWMTLIQLFVRRTKG